MNLHQALSDIAEIRAQLDRNEAHRGFRSLTIGVSVLFLLVASVLESRWLQTGSLTVGQHLMLWLGVAFVAAGVAVIEMVVRATRSTETPGNRRLIWRVHWALVRGIAPSMIVGALLTYAVYRLAEGNEAEAMDGLGQTGDGLVGRWLNLLPAIWSMIYSLGLFHCVRHLPRWSVVAAVYFLVAGVFVLLVSLNGIGNLDETTHLGWQMTLLFGVGQSILAIILYWNLERLDGQE